MKVSLPTGPVRLEERMTFDQLFRVSDPKRVARSFKVRGPPLEIDSYQDTVYYIFNFKSSPSTTGLRHKGYLKFFKPKSGRQTPLQHVECLVDCTCFSGDTRVLMSDGTYKPISEIRPGDYVYTHRGRVKPVIGNVERKLKPGEKVYDVKITGFPGSVTATGSHPFYALRGNSTCACGCGKSIWDLKESYFREHSGRSAGLHPRFLLNRRFIHGHNSTSDGTGSVATKRRPVTCENPFAWIKVEDFREKEWFLTPWIKAPEKPDRFNVDLARLLGYYAAEGHFHKSKSVRVLKEGERRRGKKLEQVYLTLHRKERDCAGRDIERICRNLGYGYRVKKHSKNAIRVVVTSAEFRRLCAELVGFGSETKRLAATVFQWNDQALLNFVTGAFIGDGHLVKATGEFGYTTVSFDLAAQIAAILNRLHMRYGITKGQKRKGKNASGKTNFTVTVFRGSPETLRAELVRVDPDRFAGVPKTRSIKFRDTDQGQLRTMRTLDASSHVGTVWDLTVEDDESFIVNGVAVHNCPDYRYRFSWANKQRQSGVVGPNSLNQAWNKAPRKTNPTGKPGMCKHLLAAREYIYGLLSAFPGNEPDTAEKLNKLTRYATKRWTDFPAQVRQAKARERELQQRIQQRKNFGKPIEPEEVEKISLQPPQPAKPAQPARPAKPGTPANPARPAAPPVSTPTQSADANKDSEATGTEAQDSMRPPPPPTRQNYGPFGGYQTKAEQDFWKKQGLGDALISSTENILLETVVNTGDDMTKLQEAIKLVQEMVDEQTAPAPTDVGSAIDSGAELDAGVEPLEPSEPPISDSALGADTEGETALGLLSQMRDLLAQMATALAPEAAMGAEPDGDELGGAMPPGAGPIPGAEGHPEPDGDEEAGAGEGAEGPDMPDIPPADEESPDEGPKDKGEKDDDDDDDDGVKESRMRNRRPVA